MSENQDSENYENHVIFKTLHGSHLYGLNHADSDLDLYVVHNSPIAKNEMGDIAKTNVLQTIVDGIDATVMDWKTFHIHASLGVPQALEAMFSQKAEIDVIKAWRNGFNVSVPAMAIRYQHAIEKFAAFDFKRRRHAVRYALNLESAMKNGGYFNPTMSQREKDIATEIAMSPNYAQKLIALSPVELKLNVEAIQRSLEAEAL